MYRQSNYRSSRFLLLTLCLIVLHGLSAFHSFGSLYAQTTPSLLLPPTDLRGAQIANRFASQADLINEIFWRSPSEGTPPVAYKIYRNSNLTELAATISADQKLRFRDHNRKKHQIYTYYIVSVDEAGNQSAAAIIRFIGAKVRVFHPVLTKIEVTPIDPVVAVNFTIQFTATGIFSDNSKVDLTNKVQWSSSNPTVATISDEPGSKGLATGLSPGTTVIEATVGGISGRYSSSSSDRSHTSETHRSSGERHRISGSTTLTVTTAQLVSIEIDPEFSTLAAGYQLAFTATGIFSDGTTENLTNSVNWESSNPAVAVISKGLATGLSPGTTTIKAILNGISGSTQLTVTNAVLTSINITPIDPSIAAGYTLQFIATAIFSDGTTENITTQVTWSSSNPGVAVIDSQGLAIAITVGSTTITAALGNVTGLATLNVTSAVLESITVTPFNPSVTVGRTVQFTATGVFSNGTTQNLTAQVTWSSSNSAVADISNAAGGQGEATGVAVGTTTISATSENVTGSTTLTVTSAVLESITVTPFNPIVAVGRTVQFTATGVFSDGTTANLTTQVTWNSSNSKVAVISNAAGSQGLAQTLDVDTITISATSENVTGSTTLTVTSAVLESITVTPFNPSLAVGRMIQFTATGSFSDGTTEDLTTQVTWGSSNPEVAEIYNVSGSQGLAQTLDVGPTIIKASSGNVTGSTTLTVTSAVLESITVTPANPSIAFGRTIQFTATGSFSDGTTQDLTAQVTWESSNSDVAVIYNVSGSQGLAQTLDVGTTIIKASSGNVTGSTTLTVTPAVLDTITVTPVNPSIALGYTIQFTATGSFSDGTAKDLTTQVTWNSSDQNVAKISNASGSQGLAQTLHEGTTTIEASLGAVKGSTTLTVTPATLESITVTPATPSILGGETIQFTATGSFSDGTTEDLTTQATWSSSNTGVADISNAAADKGAATGNNAGSTTITATQAGVSGSTTLTVTCSAVSFRTETLPDATVGGGYYQFVEISTTASAPFRFAIVSGSLPTGLILSPTNFPGLFAGTITASGENEPSGSPGTYTFTIRVTTSCGSSTQRTFTITLNE